MDIDEIQKLLDSHDPNELRKHLLLSIVRKNLKEVFEILTDKNGNIEDVYIEDSFGNCEYTLKIKQSVNTLIIKTIK